MLAGSGGSAAAERPVATLDALHKMMREGTLYADHLRRYERAIDKYRGHLKGGPARRRPQQRMGMHHAPMARSSEHPTRPPPPPAPV